MRSLFQTCLVSPSLPLHSLSQYYQPGPPKQINGIDLGTYLSPPHQSSQSCPLLSIPLSRPSWYHTRIASSSPSSPLEHQPPSAPPSRVYQLIPQHTEMTFLKQIILLFKIIQWLPTALGRSPCTLAYPQGHTECNPLLPMECDFWHLLPCSATCISPNYPFLVPEALPGGKEGLCFQCLFLHTITPLLKSAPPNCSSDIT